MTRSTTTLTELARLGFSDLGAAGERIAAIPADVVPVFARAADPDLALAELARLLERESCRPAVAELLDDVAAASRLVRVLGASEGLAASISRHPEHLAVLREEPRLPGADELVEDLLASVDGLVGEPGWLALRARYRRGLLRIASWDLESGDALAVLDRVAAALADLAGAALEASLDVARRGSAFPDANVAATRLAIIGMGKAGARELNYLSDVDVIFVAEGSPLPDGERLPDDRAVSIATRLAIETMKGIHELAVEPPLWEVDANLRPEGKDGALVRTLESHVAYYERWAKGWEFQALLKSRPMAGDRELGARYREAVEPFVWRASTRDHFVEDVQRMRERVTAHIPADEVDVQLKLGPGGLRDIEFTIQLLQLVHGREDDGVRERSTLDALRGLADRGYIGRVEAAEFAGDYRFLRVLEHRIQLSRLRRTHLVPRDAEQLRVLARASGLAPGAVELTAAWQRVKSAVRSLHERLFYRPLLAAVAALPQEGASLTSAQAADRLSAIGFRDAQGALRHIAALTSGMSRRAAIQRALLPIMLQWFADGAAPDQGLLAFRRLSEDLGEAPWFLRMLRDSSGAAQRLTSVLSGSKFVASLLERIPEAAAWLENDAELRPRSAQTLLEEAAATVARYADDPDQAASVLRATRRREVLRLAIGGMLGVTSIDELGRGLSDVTTAVLTGALALAHPADDGLEFAVIAMGRYGGAELGFGSDADVMYVARAVDVEPEVAQRRAETIVRELKRLTEDVRLPLDLDIDLRPEGKNGPVVRSLDSYRAYYARWSLTWEAQALLRARPVAGDARLLADFAALADEVRFPAELPGDAAREVRRIKARVESERLPRGADPARHLKLGRGSLSDVEWLVQLIQLQHGAAEPGLRTTSTLEALDAAVAGGHLTADERDRLRSAWTIASRARSAVTLWTNSTADVLPSDRQVLEGVARLMEYAPGAASQLEEDYLRSTRLARQTFETRFYGPRPTA